LAECFALFNTFLQVWDRSPEQAKDDNIDLVLLSRLVALSGVRPQLRSERVRVLLAVWVPAPFTADWAERLTRGPYAANTPCCVARMILLVELF
jgi:hypothetical protein